MAVDSGNINFKIKFGDEIRRLSMESIPTFQKLQSTVRNIFSVPEQMDIQLKYEDDEKDLVLVSSNLEFQAAITFFSSHRRDTFVFHLYKKPKSDSDDEFIIIDDDEVKDVKEVKVEEEEEMKDIEDIKEEEMKDLTEMKVSNEGDNLKEKQKEIETTLPIETKSKFPNIDEIKLKSPPTSLPQPTTSKSDIYLVDFKARNGTSIKLDMSTSSLDKFMITSFTRVNTPKGPGCVLGVDPQERFLWFQLDCDNNGISYWHDVKDYESLIAKGIYVIDDKEPITKNSLPEKQIQPSISTATTTTTIPPKENYTELADEQMINVAIRESLLDQRQLEIRQYHEEQLKTKASTQDPFDSLIDDDDDK